MEYDSQLARTVRAFQNKTAFNITPVTEQDLENALPPGWCCFIPFIMHLTGRLESCNIKTVAIESGLLRITAFSPNKFDNEIFEKVAQRLAVDSRLICMVCGKTSPRSLRKKQEPGNPSLCGPHFIQFVNFLDDQINSPELVF
jgi:hypothetical protein